MTLRKNHYSPKLCSIKGRYGAQLSPILNIFETRNNRSPQDLDQTCRYLDSVGNESGKRGVVDESAAVFNVADRLPLETYKLRILKACNIFHYQFCSIRLRKICNRTAFPQSFNFLAGWLLKLLLSDPIYLPELDLSSTLESLPKGHTSKKRQTEFRAIHGRNLYIGAPLVGFPHNHIKQQLV